ncbi:MAG: hypothetical protein COX57_05720 [Alphaproteobacteria bacterium CG_4_10_14_0_2_um_filter_63_37]|nr:MAG: hypothetical protein COX57_05720 [Alphaproteobacteria bacterium CG_4_10_14_0_2_um_filter_63_37]
MGVWIPPGAPITGEMFPNLAAAVSMVCEEGQSRWMGYAGGKNLPNGMTITPRTGTYLRSIQIARHGPFHGEVFSDAPHARAIEFGSPARDLKQMLSTSHKVRLSKTGKRYLIIPFRWGTPGSTMSGRSMPEEVHQWFADKNGSFVVGSGDRRSGTGAYWVSTRSPVRVNAPRYSWGDRLRKQDLSAMGIHGVSARNMAGMVRMQNPAPEAKQGAKHSEYLTFRIMTEDSKGWLSPAQPGKFPAKQTAEELRRDAKAVVEEAVRRDVQNRLMEAFQ